MLFILSLREEELDGIPELMHGYNAIIWAGIGWTVVFYIDADGNQPDVGLIQHAPWAKHEELPPVGGEDRVSELLNLKREKQLGLLPW